MNKKEAIALWLQDFFPTFHMKTNLVFIPTNSGTFINTKDHLYDHKDECSRTLYKIFSGKISLPEKRIRELYKTIVDVKTFAENVLV